MRKYLEEEWQRFEKKTFPLVAAPDPHTQEILREVFFAGAAALFRTLNKTTPSDPNAPTAHDLAVMDVIVEELVKHGFDLEL